MKRTAKKRAWKPKPYTGPPPPTERLSPEKVIVPEPAPWQLRVPGRMFPSVDLDKADIHFQQIMDHAEQLIRMEHDGDELARAYLNWLLEILTPKKLRQSKSAEFRAVREAYETLRALKKWGHDSPRAKEEYAFILNQELPTMKDEASLITVWNIAIKPLIQKEHTGVPANYLDDATHTTASATSSYHGKPESLAKSRFLNTCRKIWLKYGTILIRYGPVTV
jgi:hypothetical protein